MPITDPFAENSLPGRETNFGTLVATSNLEDGEDSVEHTSHTLTGDKTSSDGEGEQVERLGLLPLPDQREGGTHAHGDRVVGLGNNETKTDGVPVGDVDMVLGGDDGVLGNNGEHRDDGEANGSHTRRQADGELGRDDGNGDSLPGSDGGSSEGALLGGSVSDAWVSLGEEDEETSRDKDRPERTEELSPELVARLGTEKVTSFKITNHVDRVRSSRRGDRTGDQVLEQTGSTSLALATESTTDDELRSLGEGTDGVGVGSTGSLDTDEREDEGEDDSKNNVAEVHVELESADQASEDNRKEEATGPGPDGDLVLLLDGVRDGILVDGSLLASDLAVELHDTGADTTVNGGTVHTNLGERVGKHHKNTGPETPVSWRGGVEGLLAGVEAHRGVRPSEWLRRGSRETSVTAASLSSGNDGGTNHGPHEERTTKERERSVHTGEHTSTKESGGPLDDPAPVVDDESLLPTPLVEPVKDVPVHEDTGGVLVDDDKGEGGGEGVHESTRLLLGSELSSGSVKRSHSEGSGGRRREDELLLEDVELAERDGEEDTVVGRDSREGDETPKVLEGVVEEIELVHGGNGGDEHAGERTSSGGSSLDSAVLTGTEETTTELLGEGLLHDLDDRVTENGTEERGTEGETGLETEVDVGGRNNTSKDGTDEKGTDGELGGLLGEVVKSELLAGVEILGDVVLVTGDGLLLRVVVAGHGKLAVESVLGRDGRLLLIVAGRLSLEAVLFAVVGEVSLSDLVGLVVHLAPSGGGSSHGEERVLGSTTAKVGLDVVARRRGREKLEGEEGKVGFEEGEGGINMI